MLLFICCFDIFGSALKDVHVTESMKGADCLSHHRLVRARVSLTTQRPHRKSAPKPPRRLDTGRQKDPVTQQLLSANSKTSLKLAPLGEDTEIDRIWGATRNAVHKASLDSVGTTKRRHQDWFDKTDQIIQSLLENNRIVHQMTLLL